MSTILIVFIMFFCSDQSQIPHLKFSIHFTFIYTYYIMSAQNIVIIFHGVFSIIKARYGWLSFAIRYVIICHYPNFIVHLFNLSKTHNRLLKPLIFFFIIIGVHPIVLLALMFHLKYFNKFKSTMRLK